MQTPTETRNFWLLAALGGAVTLIGLIAAHTMELHGHAITGMDNQVVWGLPHVFAIFMIVAASGVLNVASIGSVFGHAAYKARAPLSGLLCLALLSGGLFVLITLSVILQVASFKLTGKRIFRMAPLQHHFELLGWLEETIVIRFWIIAGLFVALGLGLFYAEWVVGTQ